MSALVISGHGDKSAPCFALPPIADIARRQSNFRFVPIAEIVTRSIKSGRRPPHMRFRLMQRRGLRLFSLCVGDETSRCRSVRTCIRSGHACIDEVASEARYRPDIRYRTVLARLRTRPVLAKCERRGPSRACAHSEAHAVSGRFETNSCASGASQGALVSSCRREVRSS